jgi:hypothetical protein
MWQNSQFHLFIQNRFPTADGGRVLARTVSIETATRLFLYG